MENRKKFALAIFCLMVSGLIFAFLPQAEGATAMTDIKANTYFKYRSMTGNEYNVSLDLTFTDNSTSIYKVAFSYDAYLASHIEGNGTAYIYMANRTIKVCYYNGTVNFFPNGTESIFYIEPKLKRSATFAGNLPHCSILNEGNYKVFQIAKFYNLLTAETFAQAIYAHNTTANATGPEYYINNAVFEYSTGINLYQETYMENFWVKMFLKETNFTFPTEAAPAAQLNLTNTIITIALVMVGLIVLAAGIRRK